MAVIAGVLIAAAGLVIVLLVGGATTARPTLVPAIVRTAAWPGTPRLRAAREQLTETLGPLGAFVLLLGGGVLVVTPVVAVFGFGLAALEHPVDWWAFHLADRLHGDGWASAMNVATKMGNLFQTRVAGVFASVVLALVVRRRRWAPAVLILGVIVVEKYQQSMLAAIVDRGHPPTTLGTYPSGGCARLIAVYGVILLLILEYARAGRRTRGVAWTLLWAAAFTEGYSRWYLNKHWLTDVIGGWVYGGLLLAVAVFAGRALIGAGRARRDTAPDAGSPAAEEQPVVAVSPDS